MTEEDDRSWAENMYMLDENNEPVEAVSFKEYVEWSKCNDKRVALFENKDVKVSTVFLSLNHDHWGGIALWETMIFGGEHDMFCERYSSYKLAAKGHHKAIEMIFKT